MRLRPSSDKITIYRRVVSFWQRTMSKCMPDLQESDQKTVLEVITKGEGLDGAVIDAISGFPTVFHAGMIADLRSGDEEDYRRAQEDAVTKAENSLWEAKMLAFKTLLDRDVATIQRAAAGHLHLQDKSLDTKLFFHFYRGWVRHQVVDQILKWGFHHCVVIPGWIGLHTRRGSVKSIWQRHWWMRTTAGSMHLCNATPWVTLLQILQSFQPQFLLWCHHLLHQHFLQLENAWRFSRLTSTAPTFLRLWTCFSWVESLTESFTCHILLKTII